MLLTDTGCIHGAVIMHLELTVNELSRVDSSKLLRLDLISSGVTCELKRRLPLGVCRRLFLFLQHNYLLLLAYFGAGVCGQSWPSL